MILEKLQGAGCSCNICLANTADTYQLKDKAGFKVIRICADCLGDLNTVTKGFKDESEDECRAPESERQPTP